MTDSDGYTELYSPRSKIVKDTSRYLGTKIVTQMLGIVRGMVVARLLGPAAYGIWHGLRIILDYSPYSGLGLVNAMDREYPYHIGRKEYQRAEQIKDTAFGINVFLCVLVSLLLMTAAFFLKDRYPPVVITGLVVMAIAALLQQVNVFYRELARLEKRVDWVSKMLLCFSVINCLLSIILVIRYRIYGLYGALLAAYMASISYILWKTKLRFKFHIDRRQLRRLLKIGLPLALIPLMSTILRSLDRLMILRFLGTVQLGYYGISTMIAGFILCLPVSAHFVTYPHLLEEYGRTQRIAGPIRKYVVSPTVTLAYLLSVLIGGMLVIVHLPIRYFLPSFLPGLVAIKILIVGIFFFSLIFLPADFLVALKKHSRVLMIQALCILLNGCLNYFLIMKGMGIEGVALATTISYLVLGTTMMGYVIRHFSDRKITLFKFFVKIYSPFIYALGVFYLLNLLVVKDIVTLGDDIQVTSLRLLLFVIFASPLLYYIYKQRRTQINYEGKI